MLKVDSDMNIFVTKGDSAELTLTLTSGGSTYDYSDDTVRFGVKRSAFDKELLIEKTVEDGKIVLTPDDYEKIDGYGDLIYAIEVQHTEDGVTSVYTPIVAKFSIGYDVL